MGMWVVEKIEFGKQTGKPQTLLSRTTYQSQIKNGKVVLDQP
jgi:hypothetical protein